MAASSGFATIHTSAEADEDATYTFNRDGVRLEVATYEFPRKIIVNSSSHTKKYHWRRNGGNYHISDNRENAEPADGKAQFLEIGRILSGDEPGRYLFKKMRLDKPEKDAWRSGSKFLKDSRALPVFVKCSKYLPTQAKILVGYRRDAETRLLDLEGVDIDNVFFYQEILTPEILASPVHDRIPKTTSKVREFAAEIKMKNPDSVPKLTIVNSTTDTTSMLSQFSVSELDHVDDTIRMMLDAIENSESDTTPLQAMHAIMEQRLLVVRTPSTDMMAKFVDDETYFSLEDTRKLQHELKVQYPESRSIDLNFTQVLHTAIHKEKLAETISERDVVKFLEMAHMLREQMELSEDDDAQVEAMADLAAAIVAKSSEVDLWTSPPLTEHDSDS